MSVVELFTYVADGVWMVGWKQFDATGDLVAEGRVSRTAASVRHDILRELYTMSLDLRLARLPYQPVGKAVLRVEAPPTLIARATDRDLMRF
jgi:hypothetical protein